MATIYHVKTPDGVIHDLGGGGGTAVTYTLDLGTLSNNTVPIVLTGSDSSTDTIYLKGAGGATMSVSGDTVTITTSTGQVITYTFTGSGDSTTYTITATPSSGTAQTVTIPAATQSAAGLMTSSDKTKLDGIESGTVTHVPVSKEYQLGDSSVMNMLNSGIHVEFSGVYRVDYSAYIARPNAGIVTAFVRKSSNSGAYSASTEMAASNGYTSSGSVAPNTSASLLLSLQDDDIIYLAVRSYNATGTLYNDNNMTYISVQYLGYS